MAHARAAASRSAHVDPPTHSTAMSAARPDSMRATRAAAAAAAASLALLIGKLVDAAHGSTRTGLKMVLQRRLHAMLMQSAIERQAREMEDYD